MHKAALAVASGGLTRQGNVQHNSVQPRHYDMPAMHLAVSIFTFLQPGCTYNANAVAA